jgi:hypothetical protein
MLSEYFQIKSFVESIEYDSRKICYLCLPKSQWITDSKEELADNNLCEMERVNE